MRIERNCAVTLRYILTDADGVEVDRSHADQPLTYVHGVSDMLPGLASGLEGHQAGEALRIELPPAHAYGERDDSLMQVVPKGGFDVEPQTGMQFQARSDQGPCVVTVVAVTDDEIVIDTNHPLAGVALCFEVEILEVRPATEAEVAAGRLLDGERASR